MEADEETKEKRGRGKMKEVQSLIYTSLISPLNMSLYYPQSPMVPTSGILTQHYLLSLFYTIFTTYLLIPLTLLSPLHDWYQIQLDRSSSPSLGVYLQPKKKC